MSEETAQNNLNQNNPAAVNPQDPNAGISQNIPKKNNKKLIVVALMILFLIVLSSAGVFIVKHTSQVPQITPTPKVSITELTPTPAAPEILESSPSAKISTAHNYFGFNILQKLLVAGKETNIFISPSSIYLALSMTYNGASGETKEAMSDTLGIKGVSNDEVNKANASLIKIIQNPDPQVQIAIANSIWTKKGETFNSDFLTVNQKYYGAKIESLDFTDSKTVGIINGWVSENTRGKIPSIIQPPIPPDMVMYLINAIYFKGTWTVEFDKKLTSDRPFTLNDGTAINHPMMWQKGDFLYLENDQFQAVNLPYGKNKRLGMFVFLPKEKLEDFTKQLTNENWQKWLTEFKEKEGTVILPKFKLEYENNLNSALKSLGMTVAFDSQADFSKMRANPLQKDLFISEVIHKTYVDVNEEGTEAAAVTEVGMKATAARPDETFFMEVNKPFYFAIVDRETSELLFMGIILEPKYSS